MNQFQLAQYLRSLLFFTNQIIGVRSILSKIAFALFLCLLFLSSVTSTGQFGYFLAIFISNAIYVVFYSLILYYFEYQRMADFVEHLNQDIEIENMRLKELLELESANKFKDLVLASVSHDLRTPTYTCKQQIQLALEQEPHLAAETQRHLQIAIKNCDRLTYQIADILEYSNYQRFEKIRVNPNLFQIAELVSDLKDVFLYQCELKGLSFAVEIANTNVLIYSDFVRLMQILINLISNSIKFTSCGFVRVEIREQTYWNCASKIQEDTIGFRVSDSGIGMSSDQLAHLFQFYVSYDSKTGHGLGLALSKKMVGALGPEEEIAVRSSPGEGSCFEFQILRVLNTLSDESLTELELQNCNEFPVKNDIKRIRNATNRREFFTPFSNGSHAQTIRLSKICFR